MPYCVANFFYINKIDKHLISNNHFGTKKTPRVGQSFKDRVSNMKLQCTKAYLIIPHAKVLSVYNFTGRWPQNQWQC